MSLGFGARARVIGGAGAILALAAFALAYAGQALCLPPALPGDEAWHRGYLARQALRLLAGLAAPDCPLETPAGAALVQAVTPVVRLAWGLPLLALLWEAAGWPLRLALLRRRGGHAVLAGPPSVTGPVAPVRGARLWLLPAGEGAEAGAAPPGPRRRPAGLWRHSLPLARVLAPGRGPDPGLGRAAVLVAAAPDDLANLRLARRALEQGFRGRLLVQIEQRALRGLAADALRAEAEAQGAALTVVAPHVVQARKALALAMPGRYRDDAAAAAAARPDGPGATAALHLALSGDGPQLDDLMQRIARQGYGLEQARPRLSVLRIADPAGSPPSPPPAWAEDLLDLAEATVEAEAPARIDAAIAQIAARPGRLQAVFCVSQTPGLAALLARRWEGVLDDLGLPVPPLLALETGAEASAGGAAGATPGLAIPVPLPGLAGIEAEEAALDRRAQAVHRHYLALTGGVAPGDARLPARRPWADLPERYREDNRAAADHLAYKMARLGIALRPGRPAAPLVLTPAEVDLLAPVEHARWVAARRVAGWTPGPRDEAAMTHPDLVPYAALDDAGREKDRDQVARLPVVAALGDEGMAREVRLRADPGGLSPAEAAGRAVAALEALSRRDPARVPLLCGTLDPGQAALLEAAQAAGHLTELVLADPMPPADWTPLARRLRRGAHRLRVTPDPAAALPELTLHAAVSADQAGKGGPEDAPQS